MSRFPLENNPTYSDLLSMIKSSPEVRNQIASLMKTNANEVETKIKLDYFKNVDAKRDCNGPDKTLVPLSDISSSGTYNADCALIKNLVTTYNRHRPKAQPESAKESKSTR